MVITGEHYQQDSSRKERLLSVKLTEKDSGRKITVHTGSLITLCLKEIPTSGYRWSYTFNKPVEVVDDHFREAGEMGAGGNREITLRFPQKSLCRIHLEKRREWEQHNAPFEFFTCDIDVK